MIRKKQNSKGTKLICDKCNKEFTVKQQTTRTTCYDCLKQKNFKKHSILDEKERIMKLILLDCSFETILDTFGKRGKERGKRIIKEVARAMGYKIWSSGDIDLTFNEIRKMGITCKNVKVK